MNRTYVIASTLVAAALLCLGTAARAEIKAAPRSGSALADPVSAVPPPAEPRAAFPPGQNAGQAAIGLDTSSLVTSLSVEDVLEHARTIGIGNPRITTGADGQRRVEGDTSGVDVRLRLERCTGDVCLTITYSGLFGPQDASVDLVFINKYNNVSFGQLYRGSGGELFMRYHLHMDGGVTRDNVRRVGLLFVAEIKRAIAFQPS